MKIYLDEILNRQNKIILSTKISEKLLFLLDKFYKMSKTDQIISEINLLNDEELDIIYQELLKKISKLDRLKNVLKKVRGKGKGVWGTDAQEYVNEIRDYDRF